MFKPNPDRTLANANEPGIRSYRNLESSALLRNVVIDQTGYYAVQISGKITILARNPNYIHGACCRPI